MVGVARFSVLAAVGIAIAGCVTAGMEGIETEAQAAKPRVIDTPKTLPKTAAKQPAAKQAARPAPAAEEAQGDTGQRTVAARSEPDEQARPRAVAARSPDVTVIPAQSLFGNWTLGLDGGSQCRIVLGGVPIGAAYAARGEADCPPAFTSVQTWEIQGSELVLRNQSRGIVGRLQPTGPYRFDGQGDGGALYLVR